MIGLSQEIIWQQVQTLLPDDQQNNALALCVAFSGGVDSTVLLHALAELRKPKKFSLRAIHINHQLQKDASSWAQFCEDFCANHKIECQTVIVQVSDSKKLGLEAAAREARYAAIIGILTANEILLTAHHLDDHVETVFLQILRGTGLEGGSGIKASTKKGEFDLIRPLLSFNRQQLIDYADSYKLTWIEDPSNQESQHNRNYLRHHVLPLIENRWPSYRQTVKRFSEHVYSAATLINEQTNIDYLQCLNVEKNTLSLKSLLDYSLEKQSLIIRHWVTEQKRSLPSSEHMSQIHGLIQSKVDAQPIVEWGNVQLRRYRDEIYLLSRPKKSFQTQDVKLDAYEQHLIQGLGTVSIKHAMGQGINSQYADATMKIGFRKGGEKCRPANRSGSHSLKKLFQEYAIPPWLRDRIPLLFIDDEIAAVIGYFYCEPFVAGKSDQSFTINIDYID